MSERTALQARELIERDAALQARELIVFCDAIQEAGFPELARRSRVVARDLLETLDMLGAERSARRAMQETCQRWQNLFGRRADDELIRAARRRGLA